MPRARKELHSTDSLLDNNKTQINNTSLLQSKTKAYTTAIFPRTHGNYNTFVNHEKVKSFKILYDITHSLFLVHHNKICEAEANKRVKKEHANINSVKEIKHIWGKS